MLFRSYKGGFSEGFIDGKGFLEDPDGTRHEGEFSQGRRIGTFIVRDNDGNIIRTINY